jgi:hypothetical protein
MNRLGVIHAVPIRLHAHLPDGIDAVVASSLFMRIAAVVERVLPPRSSKVERYSTGDLGAGFRGRNGSAQPATPQPTTMTSRLARGQSGDMRVQRTVVYR